MAGQSQVYTLHLWPPLAHAKHYTGSARENQVQVERGGRWVLAQVQPGGRNLERQLKQHGAARRCEVCKAVEGYQSGELAKEEALSRAGWERSSETERSTLM